MLEAWPPSLMVNLSYCVICLCARPSLRRLFTQGIDLGIIAFRNETLEQESMADPFRIKNNRFIDNIVEEDIRVKHLKTKCLA